MDMKEYKKEWYLKNKEKRQKQMKEYHENNKEYMKEYRENNKEKIAQQKKDWGKTEKAIKYNRISSWKKRGLIHDDVDALYEHYINTTECNVCKCNFTDKNIKCLDHDHTNGQFRYILCKNCNHYDNWKKKLNLFI